MRQFAGFGSAEDTNERFRYLLSQGQTGISVAFDLPTLMGYDSDHPLAEGEVGKCGVAISSLADMEDALRQNSARRRLYVNDDQFSRRNTSGQCIWPSRKSRAWIGPPSAARCRTTS